MDERETNARAISVVEVKNADELTPHAAAAIAELSLQPSGSVRVTTCFVTWSATTAAIATVASPAHCHAPAPSERSATETGARP